MNYPVEGPEDIAHESPAENESVQVPLAADRVVPVCRERLLAILETGGFASGGLWSEILSRISEWVFLLIEAALVVFLLRHTEAHPLAIGAAALWALFRVLGFWRRVRRDQAYRSTFEQALTNLREERFPEAFLLLVEAMKTLSHDHPWAERLHRLARDRFIPTGMLAPERLWIAYVYCAARLGRMDRVVWAARRLRYLHIRRHPKRADREVYHCLLSDPSLAGLRGKLTEILEGSAHEAFHTLPGAAYHRAIQIAIALLCVTVVATVVTALLTYLQSTI